MVPQRWFDSKQKFLDRTPADNRFNTFNYYPAFITGWGGPSNDSSYDSTFIPTQHFNSSEESSEESVISSDGSSNESFENVNSHSLQSTKKSQGNKIQRSNQDNRSQNIRCRGRRATTNRTPQTQQTQYTDEGRNTKRQFPSTSASRVNVQPEDPKSPMSILKTFLTDECIPNIVDSTNKYAEILFKRE